MDDWVKLERALKGFTDSGAVEVREDGEWLADLAGFRWELHQEGKRALIHLWSEDRNLTRRLLHVIERDDERIVLEVQRFGRAKSGRLEFLRADSPRPAGRHLREHFRSRFRRILAERFPDAEIEMLSAAPDLEHSFSGLYVRGRMREGSLAWALLAAPGEDATATDDMLTFGLLWLDWSRGHAERRAVAGLRLFVPAGLSRLLRERIVALSAAARAEIFEFSSPDGRVEQVDPADSGNLESWLMPRREAESALHAAAGAVEHVRALAPKAAESIDARALPAPREVALRFRGLEFARWSSGQLSFGLGDVREKVSESENDAGLERLIRQLGLHRSSLAEDAKHPLFRAAPERWLESLVLEDPTRLDAQLDPRHLYSQLPAVSAGTRGVLDLLGVTRRGRLVVIELKASEDIQMPVQALDYWLRVRQHQRRGDFPRYGYFQGVELDPAPPLVWLVAPGLRFHPATDILLRYLSPEIEVTRIGLNENWRRGIRVLFRQ